MDDLISRQAAIDALMAWEEDSVWDEECLKHRGEPYWVAPSDVINQMPSAQPELIEQIRWERDIAIEQLNELGYSFGEKIRTDSDTISRQAAIAVADSSDYVGLSVDDVKKVTDEVVKGLKRLPSAQSEIIRCKDCVNHVDDRCLVANHHTGDIEYCMEVFGAKRKGEQP